MNTSLAPRYYPIGSSPVARPLAPPESAMPLKQTNAAGVTGVPSFAEVLKGVTGAASRQAAGAAAGVTAAVMDDALSPDRLSQAARQMEGVFLNLLWKQAWNTAGGSFFPSGLAGDIYKDFLTEALSDRMAEAGGIGLARLIRASQGPQAQSR